jgi:hypothetical protein
MKISKLLNENRIIGKFVYIIFRTFHSIKNIISAKNEFKLLGDLPPKLYVPFHPNPESNLYGHIQVFKKYLDNTCNLENIHIQHGVILGDLVQDIMKKSFADTIITYSEKRKKKIQSVTSKNIIAVGPYINYAKNRLNPDRMQSLKKDYGKSLLVFPAHSSVERTRISFNHQVLIEKINEIKQKNNIKTVFVNLFYSDCNKTTINFYEKQGFIVCSAGYWLSENFLHNLRTLIELSDITMSNKMGTHIGYCLALGKPHFIFKQEYDELFVGNRSQEDKKQTEKHEYLTKLDTDKIESLFLNDDFNITQDQIDIVDEFWGNSIFHDKTKLKSLLG